MYEYLTEDAGERVRRRVLGFGAGELERPVELATVVQEVRATRDCFGMEVGIGRDLRGFCKKVLGPVKAAGRVGREPRSQQSASPRLVVRRQPSGALERRGFGGDAAPLSRDSRCLLQRSRHLLVRSLGRGGEMPRTPIRRARSAPQSLVGAAPLRRRRRLVKGRPRQRVRQLETAPSRQEAGPLGLRKRLVRFPLRLERGPQRLLLARIARGDRKSTRLNSSHVAISYAVFCLKKK